MIETSGSPRHLVDRINPPHTITTEIPEGACGLEARHESDLQATNGEESSRSEKTLIFAAAPISYCKYCLSRDTKPPGARVGGWLRNISGVDGMYMCIC